MNMRLLSIIAALLCALPLSAQINTSTTEATPATKAVSSSTPQVTNPATTPAIDNIVVDTAADAVLTEDESSREIKSLTGLRKRMSVEVKHNDEVIRGAVNITEHGNVSEIVNANLRHTPGALNGFRIVIYMDNSQTARGGAAAARSRFNTLNIGEPTYLTYDNPYFKVSVGNYVSKEEAMQTLGKIKEIFPDAFITQAHINVMEFAR